MNTIQISERLWFQEDPRGVTLTCWSPEGVGGTIFHVGIGHTSLRDCCRALSGPDCQWSIKDGSLTISGDAEGLRITFCSLLGPRLETSVSLTGEELTAFKWMIHTYASSNNFFCFN